MRIVFMGTPDFAACSLKKLLQENFEIVGVFTQPDKPRNRGMKLQPSEVKTVALEAGLPVFQPQSMRDSASLELLASLKPDILAVVAYGKILPDEMLSLPKYGAVNVHGSLLPKYRGAAPIQWAVLNGDAQTGVSTMHLSHDMDAGDIIYTEETEIGEQETSGELFDRLADMGAKLLVKTLRAIERGDAPRMPQDRSAATYTRQLSKDMAPIDWNRSAFEIIKHVCGLNPWPIATTELQGVLFKIFRVEADGHTDAAPGTILSADKNGIRIACGDHESIRILELQAPGKKRMRAADYLLGHPMRIEAQ